MGLFIISLAVEGGEQETNRTVFKRARPFQAVSRVRNRKSGAFDCHTSGNVSDCNT